MKIALSGWWDSNSKAVPTIESIHRSRSPLTPWMSQKTSQFTAPMMIIIIKSLDNPIGVNSRRRHNQDMENLMGTTPNIKLPRSNRLRNSSRIEERPDDQQKAFEEVVRHPALPVHLWNTEQFDAVNQWRKAREAGE